MVPAFLCYLILHFPFIVGHVRFLVFITRHETYKNATAEVYKSDRNVRAKLNAATFLRKNRRNVKTYISIE